MIPPLSCSSSESAPPPRPRAPRPLERERQRERARRAGRRQWSAPATVLLTILLAGLAGDLCAAYPSGAPEQACKELKPGHGVEAQAGPAPFELVQDRREAGPGDQIKGNYRPSRPARPPPSECGSRSGSELELQLELELESLSSSLSESKPY